MVIREHILYVCSPFEFIDIHFMVCVGVHTMYNWEECCSVVVGCQHSVNATYVDVVGSTFWIVCVLTVFVCLFCSSTTVPVAEREMLKSVCGIVYVPAHCVKFCFMCFEALSGAYTFMLLASPWCSNLFIIIKASFFPLAIPPSWDLFYHLLK